MSFRKRSAIHGLIKRFTHLARRGCWILDIVLLLPLDHGLLVFANVIWRLEPSCLMFQTTIVNYCYTDACSGNRFLGLMDHSIVDYRRFRLTFALEDPPDAPNAMGIWDPKLVPMVCQDPSARMQQRPNEVMDYPILMICLYSSEYMER